ncbi:MAG: hypothetical protein M9934_12060 [Thermomicrobiales bacterium]|nr:hypothetical protein [Thermomicrobiales bacterium]
MDDSAFDQALDALVAGHQPEQQDDLTRFVAGVYRKERDVSMPTHHRLQIATALELDKPTVISRGISYPGLEKRRSGKFAWLAIAAAALLAMTGVFNWSLPRGGDEGRFLGVPSAIPTVQATPQASGDIPDWMMPITASECPLDALVTSNAQVNPSAIWYSEEELAAVSPDVVYGPFQPASSDDAAAVVQRVRAYYGCDLAGYSDQVLPISSPRFQYEQRTTAGRDALAQREPQRIEVAKELSAFYEMELGLTPADLLIHHPDTELAALSVADESIEYLYSPAWAVQLADGRIAVINGMVGFGEEFPYDPATTPVFGAGVLIFIEGDGSWLLDETLAVCLGECDEVWEEWATALPGVDTAAATPTAAVSPNAEWLTPISPYECTLTENQVVTPTASLTLVSGDFPARVYAPLQLANAAERTDVWSAARDMRACLNAVGVETFWSDRLRYEETDRVFSVSAEAQQLSVDQIVHGQQVSDFYLNQLGVTSDQMLLHFKVGDPEVEGLDPGTYPVINPDWILQTEDGRQIVLVTAMVVSDGEMPLVTPDTSQPGGLAWVLIENDGVWQIDEYLPVCIGTEDECASFWQQQPGWATYVKMQTPSGEACTVSQDFSADYEVIAGRAVNLRPGPGIASGDPVAVIQDGQMLQYLCQRELTSDPEGDDLYEDQGWLFIRTIDGKEGWVRETNVRPVSEIVTSPASDSSPIASPEAAVTLLKPVTAEECQYPPVGDSSTGTRPSSQTRITARSYDSLETPARGDAEAAAMAARQVDSCADVADPLNFMTSSYAAVSTTMQGQGFNPLLPLQIEQTLAVSMEVSDEFAAKSDITASDMVVVIGKGNPESALVTPGDYRLSLAEFAMQTSDGRIAVPVVIATVNPDADSGTRSTSTGRGLLYVMAEEDGVWKLDDVLYLCIGECDDFFTYLAATTHVSVWHRPISSEECVGNYGVLSGWEPATIVAIGSRQYDACQQSGEDFALKTDTFAVADLDQARQLSIELEEQGANKDNIRSNVPLAFFPGMDIPIDTYAAFDPDNAVVLSDGRVAILQSEVTTFEDNAPQTRRTAQVVTRVLVWQEVDGQWRLDTEAEVCLGDCDAFWEESGATQPPPLEPIGTNPVPTPANTASTGDTRLPPIEPVDQSVAPTSTPGS